MFTCAAERAVHVTPFEYTAPAKTAVPELSTVRSEVLVAFAVDEPIIKRLVLVSPTFAWIESFADGDVVLMPRRPDIYRFEELALSAKKFVVDASVAKKFVEVAFVTVAFVPMRLVSVPSVEKSSVLEA